MLCRHLESFGGNMKFHKINSSLLLIVLTLVAVLPAQASQLVSFVAYPGTTQFAIDPANSSISGSNAGYSASAQTFYGVNKAYAAGSGSGSLSAQADSAWTVSFNLLGVPTGTVVPIIVNMAYEYVLSASGLSSESRFNILINGNTFDRIALGLTGTNAFGNDFCPELPGARPIGECAGAHSGSVSRTLQYNAGPNQALTVSAAVGVIGSGVADAFNTSYVTSIIIPDGVIFQYTDLSGNPLNVMTASEAAANGVPEPGTLGMLGASIAAVFIARAKQAKKS
jgi:hypothetical protein